MTLHTLTNASGLTVRFLALGDFQYDKGTCSAL